MAGRSSLEGDLVLSLSQALRDQEPLLKRWASLLITKLKEVEPAGKSVDMVAYCNFTT